VLSNLTRKIVKGIQKKNG